MVPRTLVWKTHSQANEVEMERFQMTPNSGEKKCPKPERAGLEEFQLHDMEPHNHGDGYSVSPFISWLTFPPLEGSCQCFRVPPLPVSIHFSLREDSAEISLHPSCSFLQTISSLPLHMLVPAVVSCLPSEGRGFHFSDCLAHFHPCIVICYWWSKAMPCCKDSVSKEL